MNFPSWGIREDGGTRKRTTTRHNLLLLWIAARVLETGSNAALGGGPFHYTHKPTLHRGPFSEQPSPSVSLFASNPSPGCASENQALTSSQGILHLELKWVSVRALGAKAVCTLAGLPQILMQSPEASSFRKNTYWKMYIESSVITKF